jgi:hypothetical protein
VAGPELVYPSAATRWNCRFLPEWQGYWMMSVPSAVDTLLTSGHLPLLRLSIWK